MMTSSQYQTLMYQNDGLMPNATGLLGVAASNPIQQVFFDAAKNSHGTPASPGWATIEADATMEGFFAFDYKPYPCPINGPSPAVAALLARKERAQHDRNANYNKDRRLLRGQKWPRRKT